MDYIIFDLEWNQPYSNDISFMKRARMPLTGEIIQIGAIKLNENLEIGPYRNHQSRFESRCPI